MRPLRLILSAGATTALMCLVAWADARERRRLQRDLRAVRVQVTPR